MSRPGRTYFNNAVYHITIRGNNKQAVLKEADDKMNFIKSLDKFKKRFKFKLYCFAIMHNHVHLVIETQEHIRISKIMQAIALSYSVKFRKKYGYVGYVWQGRFRSTVIDDEKYILACMEYIHNNPVRAGFSRRPQDYTWSSCRFYEGLKSSIDKYVEIDRYIA